jgi:hypothetical protein
LDGWCESCGLQPLGETCTGIIGIDKHREGKVVPSSQGAPRLAFAAEKIKGRAFLFAPLAEQPPSHLGQRESQLAGPQLPTTGQVLRRIKGAVLPRPFLTCWINPKALRRFIFC